MASGGAQDPVHLFYGIASRFSRLPKDRDQILRPFPRPSRKAVDLVPEQGLLLRTEENPMTGRLGRVAPEKIGGNRSRGFRPKAPVIAQFRGQAFQSLRTHLP